MSEYQTPSYPHSMSREEKQAAERQKLEQRVAAQEKAEHDAGVRDLEMSKTEARRSYIANGGNSSEFESAWVGIRRDILAKRAVEADAAKREQSRRQVREMFRS